MNTYLTHTALAATSVVLIASCGTGPGADADSQAAPQGQHEHTAGATYDGWIIRALQENRPAPCPWSPDQVQRMMDSGQPLPACVRRLQRWFQQEYDPSWRPARRADR